MNEAWEIVNKVGICRPKDMDIFELEAYKKSLPKIRCGCDELDDKLLKGGLEMESLTEIYGEYGSGKTQYCYSVAIEAIGKHDFNVLWIDCEDTFDPSRLIDAARARGFGNTDDEIRQKFYPKIKYIHTPNTDRLVREIDNLSSNILDKKYKLIILDGAIGQFREEYRGRGELSVRQNNLKRFMSLVRNIAFFFCCAVVMTNQVQSDPGLPPMMDPIKPIGGHIVGHTSSYRLYFKKAGSKRIARMVDSPKTPIAETLFELNDKGVDNVSKK